MSSPSRRNLFFPADSDSEDEAPATVNGHAAVSGAAGTSQTGAPAVAESSRQPREALFFAADDDEDVVAVEPPSRSSPGLSASSKPAPSSSLPPSSSASASTSAGPSRPTKRGSDSASSSQNAAPSVRPGFTRGYLGEFVSEGWSLSKGKGYCTPGSRVVFERPKPKNDKPTALPDTSAKLGPARLVNGKVVHAKAKIGGKQMTLGGMMKKTPAVVVSARSQLQEDADVRSRRRWQRRRWTRSSALGMRGALVGAKTTLHPLTCRNRTVASAGRGHACAPC